MHKTSRVKRILITALITGLLMPLGLLAQNFSAYNWYFGNSPNGIRFSRSTNSASMVTHQFTPFGQGGSAVASDPVTGNLLFYTDGTRVIDASHQPMPNGNGSLLGDAAQNQPVAVCRVPGKTDKYYVFHRSGGTLRFTIIDLTQIGNAVNFGQPPLGNVDNDTVNLVVPTVPAGLSEAMIILPHSNGTDFWLITHTTGTTNYNITLISDTGFGPTTMASTGFIQEAASFSWHATTNRIAVAPKQALRDVEVLTFSETPTPGFTSLLVSNSAVNGTAGQSIYDTEFSRNGQFLYVSVHGQAAPAITADVLQYDLTALSLTAQSVLPAPPPFQSYGLQMGPDSVIYHLYQATSGGPFRLGALTNTDTVAAEVNYNAQIFTGNFSGRQFPTFAPFDSLDIEVFFEASGLCANAPTTFFPTVIPGADSLNWDFGDGTVTSDWSPVHTYAQGGSFPVRLTAFLNGQSKDTVQTVAITNFDTQISLVSDTTACSCELPFSKQTDPPSPPPTSCGSFQVTAQINGSGNPTWQWFGPAGPIGSPSTGTSATLTPDSAGYYYLKAEVGGCFTYAGVNIREYGIQDQRANIWYFGQNAGLDFNPLPDDPVQPISNPVMDAPEGTATISDRNGQVIFFTDGNTVWDRAFTPIASGIGGDPGATQSSLIIPVPGDETLFYIFTTQEIYGTGQFRLSYSLFDLKVGTSGALIKQNVLLFEKSTERITGNGNWLIAHEFGNNSFRAYRISAQGIDNPVISSIGSDHSSASDVSGRGYMKLGPLNRLAVALSTPGVSNVVEVFDFVDSTGVVTNFRSLNLNSTTGQVYGVEFGAGGNKLFATLSNPGASKLYEFAFDTLGMPYEIQPPQSAATINEELGAIQLGPDGQLYVAVNNKPYLGVISVSGDTTQTSTFNVSQQPLTPSVPPANGMSRLGLPNFIQIISDPTQGPIINVSGLCFGDSTFFTGSGTDPIDTLTWIFGDGSSVKGVNMTAVRHLYAQPGPYTVRLRISNRCVGFITELTRRIVITRPPELPLTPVTICHPPEPLDANPTNAPNLAYSWSTGDTTRVINVSNPGTYLVTITNRTTGCTTDGVIEAFPSLTVIDLGPDSTVCSAPGAGLTLNTGISPAFPTNTWTRDGIVIGGNTGPTQFVDLSVPGVDVYTVEFFDPGSTCFVRDTITFTINGTPGLSVTNNGPLACTGDLTGQLAATITHTPGDRVSYIVSGANLGFTETRSDLLSGVYNIPNPAALGPDTYTVTVFDQVSQCSATEVEIINSSAFDVAANSAPVCGTGAISVEITSLTPAIPTTAGTYRVINTATSQVVDSGNKPATAV
ncbi:MAG TPA: PKD domain-containing protein, partial [Ohtaekwangia sp.]|nr:PKD domain-containing protein [Ohtaekwangia sp.]